MSQTDLVRLLPWFLSTTLNPCVIVTCSVYEILTATLQPGVEALADDTTPEFKDSHALESMSSLAH